MRRHPPPLRTVRVFVVAVATIVAGALSVAGLAPAAMAAGTAAAPVAAAPAAAVHVADPGATARTRSLAGYLDGVRGDGILFGHQHTLDDGITFEGRGDGTQSDVLAGTGEYPAIFGTDTLVLEGSEAPGLPTNTPEQNVAALRDSMEQAHRLGGINTLSAHMRNFVTGKDFTDPTGDVISHILPGGDKNAEFNAYLDRIAETASTTKDDQGNLIPIIFRPFHENTGSFFWWGAAWASPGEYQEIFRYTVEYLRDTRGVHNLLYAYSPNGTFGGDPARYLATYPGDDYVDVMGYDVYEADNGPDNSDAYVAEAVTDLAMVADLADGHHKISALTEFGRNGDRTIQPGTNKSLSFFTDLLAAIKADPKARRTSYMLTWANFGPGEPYQIYVPPPAHGDQPANDLYPDFKKFSEDPYTVFSAGLPADLYTRDVAATPLTPDVRLVSPADGVRVTTPTTTVRVKATAVEPRSVVFTPEGGKPQELTLGADGYWSATWDVGQDALTNSTVSVSVTAKRAGGADLTDTANVILGSAPQLPVGVVDDFQGYGDDAALRAEYTMDNASSDALTLVDAHGGKAARLAYDFTGDSGGYLGFGKPFDAQDWSAFDTLSGWLAPDGSNQKMVVQVQAGGVTFEAYPSLAGTRAGDIAIPFADFVPAPWDTANAGATLSGELLKSVTKFSVYLNQVGGPRSGAITVDDLRATSGTPAVEQAASSTVVHLGSPVYFSRRAPWVAVQVRSSGRAPTGQVTLSVNGKKYTADVNASGRAGFRLPKLARGTYRIVAEYGGDEATKGSKSGTSRLYVI